MLLRKMLRDMKLNKTQFISIFLLAFLGVFIYSGVCSEGNGLAVTSDRFYTNTVLADAWIYGNDFTEEVAKKVSEVEEVTGVERRLTLKSIGDFSNHPTIKLHFVEAYSISRFYLVEGEVFSLTDPDGVWLDLRFAEAKGLHVGDQISFTIDTMTLKKTIRGLVMSPEYVYSPGEDDIVPIMGNYGYGIMSYRAFPKEIPITYNELLLTTSQEVNIALENKIEEALDGKYVAIMKRSSMPSYMQFSEEIKEHQAIGHIFPFIFLAVAVLTIVTTMSRLVNNQRTLIGILKGVGFKRRRILWHYVSYGLWISITGSFTGAVVGPMILPYLFYGPMQKVFTVPEWKAVIPISVLYMVLGTIAVCTITTYLTCRMVLKDTPAQSLRPKAPKAIKHSLIDGMRLWSRMSFHSQWNLRDVIRCKGRSLMAIAGILGCSALLICAFGLQDTMDSIVEWNYHVLNRYEYCIELKSDASKDQIDDMMKQMNSESIREAGVELKAHHIKKSGELLVVEDGISLMQFVNEKKKMIKLPKDQISMSYKMAKNLNLKVGDEVIWRPTGHEQWITSAIGAIYRTPFSQGIAMSQSCYEDYGFSYLPTTLLTNDTSATGNTITSNAVVSKLSTKDDLIESYNTLANAMNTMAYTLMAAAVLLAVVVIYNLGVLSFTERQRELSTLKVMGFKTGKLRRLLLTQNIWLTVIGILPGIPVGIWIINYIFRFMGEVLDFMVIINFSSYIYCILGTLLVSALVNRVFSKRLKSIDMVSSLKGVE
jgi:putative ABC transport system permease protein